jgi:hypothetical protein
MQAMSLALAALFTFADVSPSVSPPVLVPDTSAEPTLCWRRCAHVAYTRNTWLVCCYTGAGE